MHRSRKALDKNCQHGLESIRAKIPYRQAERIDIHFDGNSQQYILEEGFYFLQDDRTTLLTAVLAYSQYRPLWGDDKLLREK